MQTGAEPPIPPPVFFEGDALRLGGPERDRTADLLLAKQALSQLSYRP